MNVLCPHCHNTVELNVGLIIGRTICSVLMWAKATLKSEEGDRRARFEREARAIASLSHPNILITRPSSLARFTTCPTHHSGLGIQWARSLGAAGLIRKPVDVEELKDTLARVFGSGTDLIRFTVQDPAKAEPNEEPI